MTDALNEQLSACLDGELPPAELDLLLKRVEREAELRGAIGRYSLIGEAMRAERPAVASKDFAGKVMAAVAAETALNPADAHATTRTTPSRSKVAARAVHAPWMSPAAVRYLRPAAGMAIAAGVAAVAVLTLQPAGQSDLANLGSVDAPLVAANQPAANEPVAARAEDAGSSYVVPTSTSNPAFIPATRLTNYVVAHSEYSSPLGRRSVLSGVLADDGEAQAIEAGERPVQISISDDGAPER